MGFAAGALVEATAGRATCAREEPSSLSESLVLLFVLSLLSLLLELELELLADLADVCFVAVVGVVLVLSWVVFIARDGTGCLPLGSCLAWVSESESESELEDSLSDHFDLGREEVGFDLGS